MKHVLLLIVLIIIMAGCNNNATDTTTNTDSLKNNTAANADTTVEVIKTGDGTSCFAYLNNRDTVLMKLNLSDNAASGRLVFNLYGKDKSKGTFRGSLLGDTLLLTYTYKSEGTTSVRQVAFLVKGDILVQGTGSMKDENGRLIFTSRKDINFDNDVVLESVECDKLGKE